MISQTAQEILTQASSPAHTLRSVLTQNLPLEVSDKGFTILEIHPPQPPRNISTNYQRIPILVQFHCCETKILLDLSSIRRRLNKPTNAHNLCRTCFSTSPLNRSQQRANAAARKLRKIRGLQANQDLCIHSLTEEELKTCREYNRLGRLMKAPQT